MQLTIHFPKDQYSRTYIDKESRNSLNPLGKYFNSNEYSLWNDAEKPIECVIYDIADHIKVLSNLLSTLKELKSKGCNAIGHDNPHAFAGWYGLTITPLTPEEKQMIELKEAENKKHEKLRQAEQKLKEYNKLVNEINKL